MVESEIYIGRGVSSSKNEIHKAIQNMDAGIFPGAFCKILPDTLTGDPDYCLIMHADGAGTKSSLAYLYWKETGDIGVFKDIAMDSLVMNLDDLACVGAVNNLVLSNTIGRNKFLIPGDVVEAVRFLARADYVTGEVVVVDGGARWSVRDPVDDPGGG